MKKALLREILAALLSSWLLLVGQEVKPIMFVAAAKDGIRGFRHRRLEETATMATKMVAAATVLSATDTSTQLAVSDVLLAADYNHDPSRILSSQGNKRNLDEPDVTTPGQPVDPEFKESSDFNNSTIDNDDNDADEDEGERDGNDNHSTSESPDVSPTLAPIASLLDLPTIAPTESIGSNSTNDENENNNEHDNTSDDKENEDDNEISPTVPSTVPSTSPSTSPSMTASGPSSLAPSMAPTLIPAESSSESPTAMAAPTTTTTTIAPTSTATTVSPTPRPIRSLLPTASPSALRPPRSLAPVAVANLPSEAPTDHPKAIPTVDPSAYNRVPLSWHRERGLPLPSPDPVSSTDDASQQTAYHVDYIAARVFRPSNDPRRRWGSPNIFRRFPSPGG